MLVPPLGLLETWVHWITGRGWRGPLKIPFYTVFSSPVCWEGWWVHGRQVCSGWCSLLGPWRLSTSSDGRRLSGILVRIQVVQVAVQRDRAWPARVILYQLALRAFARHPSGASRGAKSGSRTIYVLVEPPRAPVWHAQTATGCLQSPRARTPMAATRAFGHPRMMARFTAMAMETAYYCPNMAVDPPQTGLSSGPSADG